MIVDEGSYLEHYGKKGMKWGQRRALNKESRAKYWDKQKKEVLEARGKVASGQVKQESKDAKAQYKKDKVMLGSREAKKILRQKRVTLNETYAKSQQVTSRKGEAAVVAAMVGIGTLRIAAAVAAK